MKSKYTPEDSIRWVSKLNDGKTLAQIALEEFITIGTISGAIYRARKRGEVPMLERKKRQKIDKSERTKPVTNMSGRPDMKRPDTDGPDIISLGKNQCKFPVTQDRPYKFCGAEKTHGPYCQQHTRLTREFPSSNEASVDDAVKRLTPA